MQLLTADIHPQFDFAIPPLPARKCIMQEVEELCKTKCKVTGLDAAFTTLINNKSHSLQLILDVVFNVINVADQVAALEMFQRMKNSMSRYKDRNVNRLGMMLLDVVIAGVDQNPATFDKNAYRKRAQMDSILTLPR